MKNLLFALLVLGGLFSCGDPVGTTGDQAALSGTEALIMLADTSYTGKALDTHESSILAFEAASESAPPDSAAVLFTGSSSIRMWKSLREDFAPVPVINHGFGGSTLPEVIHYADRIIFPYAPEYIVLYCGENDIAEGASPQQAFQSFQELHTLIAGKLPAMHLLYIAMKPSPARWNLWPAYRAADELIQNYTTQHDQLHYIDCGPAMLLDSGQPDSAIFIEDQLHMNAKGYDIWETIVERELQRIMAL